MTQSIANTAWDFFEHFSPIGDLDNRQRLSIPVNHPGVTQQDLKTIQTVVNRIPDKKFKVSGDNKQGAYWLSIVVQRTK